MLCEALKALYAKLLCCEISAGIMISTRLSRSYSIFLWLSLSVLNSHVTNNSTEQHEAISTSESRSTSEF